MSQIFDFVSLAVVISCLVGVVCYGVILLARWVVAEMQRKICVEAANVQERVVVAAKRKANTGVKVVRDSLVIAATMLVVLKLVRVIHTRWFKKPAKEVTESKLTDGEQRAFGILDVLCIAVVAPILATGHKMAFAMVVYRQMKTMISWIRDCHTALGLYNYFFREADNPLCGKSFSGMWASVAVEADAKLDAVAAEAAGYQPVVGADLLRQDIGEGESEIAAEMGFARVEESKESVEESIQKLRAEAARRGAVGASSVHKDQGLRVAVPVAFPPGKDQKEHVFLAVKQVLDGPEEHALWDEVKLQVLLHPYYFSLAVIALVIGVVSVIRIRRNEVVVEPTVALVVAESKAAPKRDAMGCAVVCESAVIAAPVRWCPKCNASTPLECKCSTTKVESNVNDIWTMLKNVETQNADLIRKVALLERVQNATLPEQKESEMKPVSITLAEQKARDPKKKVSFEEWKVQQGTRKMKSGVKTEANFNAPGRATKKKKNYQSSGGDEDDNGQGFDLDEDIYGSSDSEDEQQDWEYWMDKSANSSALEPDAAAKGLFESAKRKIIETQIVANESAVENVKLKAQIVAMEAKYANPRGEQTKLEKHNQKALKKYHFACKCKMTFTSVDPKRTCNKCKTELVGTDKPVKAAPVIRTEGKCVGDPFVLPLAALNAMVDVSTVRKDGQIEEAQGTIKCNGVCVSEHLFAHAADDAVLTITKDGIVETIARKVGKVVAFDTMHFPLPKSMTKFTYGKDEKDKFKHSVLCKEGQQVMIARKIKGEICLSTSTVGAMEKDMAQTTYDSAPGWSGSMVLDTDGRLLGWHSRSLEHKWNKFVFITKEIMQRMAGAPASFPMSPSRT